MISPQHSYVLTALRCCVGSRVKASMIDCKIEHQRLTLGIKGNPPFIDVSRWCWGLGRPTILAVD